MPKQKLINQLQPFMRGSKVYGEIFNADALQLMSREERIKNIMLQCSVDTATWGLAVYEYEYGIDTDASKPLGERRSAIKAKMRGTGTVNAALLKTVAMAFTGGAISIRFDGKIIIKFIDILGLPPNLDDFFKAIDDIKPAHLDVEYQYTYTLWRDIKALGLTWGDIKAQGQTWYSVRTFNTGEITDDLNAITLTFAQQRGD